MHENGRTRTALDFQVIAPASSLCLVSKYDDLLRISGLFLFILLPFDDNMCPCEQCLTVH